MAQFPMTPDRKWALDRVPDYAVAISPAGGRAVVTCQGQVLADSSAALLVEESKHQAVFYFPRNDVRLDLLQATDHQTYCPFKGHASYWSAKLAEGYSSEGKLDNLVWSYENPFPEVAELKDHMAFYANRTSLSHSGA